MVTGEFTGTELVDADKKTVGKGAEPPPPPPHERRIMVVKITKYISLNIIL